MGWLVMESRSKDVEFNTSFDRPNLGGLGKMRSLQPNNDQTSATSSLPAQQARSRNFIMNTMHKLAITAVSIAALTACTSPQGLIDKQRSLQSQSSPAVRALPTTPIPIGPDTVGTASAMNARLAAPAPVMRSASSPWIGGAKVVHVQDDMLLPPIFDRVFQFTFDDKSTSGRVPLTIVAERLSRISGVTVRIKSDVRSTPATSTRASTGSSTLPTPFPIQAGQPLSDQGPRNPQASGQNSPNDSGMGFAEPVTALESVEARWNGSLRGYLDHITGRLGLSWSYRDGQVIVERFVTESFEISAFGGDQNYSLSIDGGNSGASGNQQSRGASTSSMKVSESGKSDILESLKNSISSIVTPSGGTVVLNEGSARFFVTAPKDVMSRVREMVKIEDGALQRQAHVQFDVYSVVTNEGDSRGLDWNMLVGDLAKTLNATIKSPASLVGADGGSTSFAILEGATGSAARFTGSKAVIQLLNERGTSVLHRPVSVLAMNHQWGRKTNIKTDGFVSETMPSTASAAGSGAPGLRTSSIATGDRVMVKPAIMNDGSIVLKFGLSFSELLGLFDVTAGSGATLQRVQTPVTSGTDDQGTILLKPGQAMVITGLSRRLANSNTRTLSGDLPAMLGGSLKSSVKVENFIVVVRAMKI
jgi:type IVB pilus formation R64 PilN family outer membrane protein